MFNGKDADESIWVRAHSLQKPIDIPLNMDHSTRCGVHRGVLSSGGGGDGSLRVCSWYWRLLGDMHRSGNTDF